MIPQRKSAQFDLPAGTKLGKYEILRKLAMGGMAEIYLARWRGNAGFEKLVVIKRILPTVADDPHFVQMFLDEARLAATLQHPNIADVYEVGEDDGAPFFAMEFIHGQDVRAMKYAARKRQETIPLAIALAIVHGIASALDYAHDRTGPDGKNLGLVHRDVSSSNILVSYEGAIKLIDFGIARATGRTHQTKVGTLKGKIPYMSPEQCRGGNVDRRSDLFSLGVVMYELTAGRRPFRGETDFAIMDQIVNDGAKPPSTLMRDYPAELEAIVMKLLARKPEDRYQSAEELLHELDPFIAQNRLWVSNKPLSRYMRTVFADRVMAWDAAMNDGQTLAQFVATMTFDSQKSDIVTPPSAFPGLLPLSQEMPSIKVTGEVPIVRAASEPHQTPLPFAIAAPSHVVDAPSAVHDMPSRPTQYPSLRSRKPMWVALAGTLALGLGGILAFTLLRDNKPPAQSAPAGEPDRPATPTVDPAAQDPSVAEDKAPPAIGDTPPSGDPTATGDKPPATEDTPPVEEPVAKPVEDKPATRPVVKRPPVKHAVKPAIKPTKPAVKPDKPAVTKPDATKPDPKKPGKEPAWDPNSPFLPPSN